jgi:hypothetical protein
MADTDIPQVDSDTFLSSDINFVVSVKVINQTINVKDQLDFFPLDVHRHKKPEGADFTKVYGDSFISGFQEGGSFLAVVNIKSLKKDNKTDIAAAAHIALQAGVGSVEGNAKVEMSKKNLAENAEINITVNWSGGGQIKEGSDKWDIETLLVSTRLATPYSRSLSASPSRLPLLPSFH